MTSTSVGSKSITYEEIKSHLVKWEKNLVSTSGVPNVATVKAALEYPEQRSGGNNHYGGGYGGFGGYNNNRGRGGYQGNRGGYNNTGTRGGLPPIKETAPLPPPPPKGNENANAIFEETLPDDAGEYVFTLTDLAYA